MENQNSEQREDVDDIDVESEHSSSGTNVSDGEEEEVAVQAQGPLRTRESRKGKAPSQSTQSARKQNKRKAAPNSSQKPPIPPKKQKSWSLVWQYFTKFEHASLGTRARCNYCDKEYAADPKFNGTSNMKNHIPKCKLLQASVEPKQTELLFKSGEEGAGAVTTWKFNNDAIRKSLARMIILDELPFSFVDGKGFKEFVANSCPRFIVPSTWTVIRDCMDIYQEEKKKLRQLLACNSGRVCLTTDTWSSCQRNNYMCVTAHFVDEKWVLHKKIIHFSPITSHKGDFMGKCIEKVLRDWGLDRVLTITVDNATNNDVAINYLKKKQRTCKNSVLDGKWLHMRCVAHILNLIVNDGLKELTKSVERIREAVRYIRNSNSQLAKFKDLIKRLKIKGNAELCGDVATRWNSTYLMLEQAQEYERVFDAYDDEDPHYRVELESLSCKGPPTIEDWENARSLNVFLKKFYRLTLKVSGSSYITSNLFLQEICTIYVSMNDLLKNSNSGISDMAARMLVKFSKYWGSMDKMNMLLYVATVLDPMKKMKFVEWCFNKMYPHEPTQVTSMMSKVNEAIVQLFEDYRRLMQPDKVNLETAPAVQATTSTSSGQTDSNMFDDEDDMLDEFRKYSMESGKEENQSELDKYLREETEPIGKGCEFDVMCWWKVNSHRFPVLSALARDVLTIPISTVASESAFSIVGRVLDVFRSSMLPSIVQALVCTQDWLRRASKLDLDAIIDAKDQEKFDEIALDSSKDSLDPIIIA